MRLSPKQIFLALGIILFLLGLIYVVSYYAQGKGTVEECRKQHRIQAWITMVVGLILLLIWTLMNFVFGRSQYY